MFAAIREVYGIERDDSLKLRDYPTLNHVVAFVRERAGAPAAPPEGVGGPAPAPAAEPAPAAPEPTAAPSEEEITARVLELVAEETGYPADMLDPELDLEADLGIDTVKQAEVFATIREAYGIERDDTLKLRDYPTLNHVVAFVRERAGGAARRRRRRAGGAGAALRPPSPPPPPQQPTAAPSEEEITDPRPRARRRGDRLPGRHARPRARPGGRPRHRHRQAGRGVRGDPRGLRDRARRLAEAARLPDAQPRRRLRARAGGRPRGAAGGDGRRLRPAEEPAAQAAEEEEGFRRARAGPDPPAAP